MIKTRTAFIFLALCFVSATLLAQERKPKKYPFRDWIRDSLPPASNSLTDLDRLDLIYLHILEAKNHKKGAALMACTGATLRHRYFPFLFGIKFTLLHENDKDFIDLDKKLPRHVFADQQKKPDNDKLQHFFASAWLTYIFNDAELADIIGLKVEKYEDLVVKGDAYDERDIRTNRLGQHFAVLLRENPNTLPGEIFRKWNEEYLEQKVTAE
ncbi:MAG: hypothetical protein ACXWEY_02330 [Bacteroidia bacterium]